MFSAVGRQRGFRPFGRSYLRIHEEAVVKIGAKATRHSRYVTFQLAEVAVSQRLFAAILDRIAQLAIPPPSVCECAI